MTLCEITMNFAEESHTTLGLLLLRADVARAVRLHTERQHLGYAEVTRQRSVRFERECLRHDCRKTEA